MIFTEITKVDQIIQAITENKEKTHEIAEIIAI
jgi:hypothetical protein